MRTKLITEPVFETYVRVLYDCSIDDVCHNLKKRFDYDVSTGEDIGGKLIVLEDQGAVLLWAKDNNMFEVIHETIHLVFHWMRVKGIPIKRSTEEVFAHLQGFYIDEINKVFEKKKKGGKRQ